MPLAVVSAVLGLCLAAGSIPLQAGNQGTVTGTVRDANGNILKDYFVQLIRPAAKAMPAASGVDLHDHGAITLAPGNPRGTPVARARTNEQGIYTIKYDSGTYELIAGNSRDGHAREKVTIEANKTVNKDLRLQK